MASEYLLPVVLEKMYENPLVEAVLMELVLWAEERVAPTVGGNIRGSLHTLGENAGHIGQGLARLRQQEVP
ncbi:hypothetical protein CVG87_05285 [Pseudomonas sp. WCS365]|nr:hypothetical protein [Pseudomonas sp. WCS365]PJH90423.1 hypothetical protein CVG87_05285 [Pseudomonas sp. WCS365]